jgi:hypothetical protein
MKKSDISALLMLIFVGLLLYVMYDAFVIRDYFGFSDFIKALVVAILMAISLILTLRWSSKETLQKYKEKMEKEKEKKIK